MRPVVSQITPEFVDTYLDGKPYYSWLSLPVQQPPEVLEQLTSELTNITTFYTNPVLAKMFGKEIANLTFGYGTAEKIVDIMYKGTKVNGIFETVPDELRGVFWMKGNGIGEELTVFQNSLWVEAEQTLLVPIAPYSWGWPAGTPKGAPHGGVIYSVTEAGALVLTGNGTGSTFSYKFGPCPSGKECTEGSNNLTYANLQVHPHGDLREYAVNLAHMIPGLPEPLFKHIQGQFDVEEYPDAEPKGSRFYRRCRWGPGSCSCLEFGSYDLVKILNGDGSPLEPYYTEFLDYMGDVPLFVWSGFTEVNETSGTNGTRSLGARVSGE